MLFNLNIISVSCLVFCHFLTLFYIYYILQFTTKGHLLTYVMKILEMDNLSDRPSSLPDTASAKRKSDWLRKVSADLVNRVWMENPPEDLRKVREGFMSRRDPDLTADSYAFCICGEGRSDSNIL